MLVVTGTVTLGRAIGGIVPSGIVKCFRMRGLGCLRVYPNWGSCAVAAHTTLAKGTVLQCAVLRPLARLRTLPETLRFRLMPRVARFALDRATRTARSALSPEAPLGVLIDNTVLDIAVTHEGKWIIHSRGGYVARVPVYGRKNISERHLQASYLTGIAHLGRLGSVRLHQSAELQEEQFRQPSGRYRGYGYADYSLFEGMKIESIDGWVFSTMGPSWMNLPSQEEQQRTRLRRSDDALFHGLYALLKQQLGEKCSQDAWHIRTAERHGLFCFLTTDSSLLKACKSLAKKEPLRSLSTRVMTPQELGTHLGIKPVKPYLLSYNNADWFVRMDHTMPGERRRKRSEYR